MSQYEDMERESPEFNKMQILKRRFFAMRNGLLADQMRRAGSPFRIIFGLNVIQLKEIASDYGHDAAMAAKLWANTTTRESMLLAPMLWSSEDFTADELVALCGESPHSEVSDMLCHRLLRSRHDAPAIADKLASSELPLMRYTALRLALALLGNGIEADRAAALADKELAAGEPLTRSLAMMLKDSAQFLLEE